MPAARFRLPTAVSCSTSVLSSPPTTRARLSPTNPYVTHIWGSEDDEVHRPDVERNLHRSCVRRGGARARAHLASDAHRQLRPGRHADGHDIYRLERDRFERLLLAGLCR